MALETRARLGVNQLVCLVHDVAFGFLIPLNLSKPFSMLRPFIPKTKGDEAKPKAKAKAKAKVAAKAKTKAKAKAAAKQEAESPKRGASKRKAK